MKRKIEFEKKKKGKEVANIIGDLADIKDLINDECEISDINKKYVFDKIQTIENKLNSLFNLKNKFKRNTEVEKMSEKNYICVDCGKLYDKRPPQSITCEKCGGLISCRIQKVPIVHKCPKCGKSFIFELWIRAENLVK